MTHVHLLRLGTQVLVTGPMAVPRVAYSHLLLSRTRAAAGPGACSPGHAAIPVRAAGSGVVDGDPHRERFHPPARCDAASSAVKGLVPWPGRMRSVGARMWQKARRVGRPVACTRTGLLARTAKLVERAWMAVYGCLP